MSTMWINKTTILCCVITKKILTKNFNTPSPTLLHPTSHHQNTSSIDHAADPISLVLFCRFYALKSTIFYTSYFYLIFINFYNQAYFFINFLTINYASTNLPLYTNSHCWFFPPIVSSPRYFMVMQRFLQVSCNAFYKFGHAHFRLKTAIFWWSIKYSLRNFSILHQFLIECRQIGNMSTLNFWFF